MTPKIAAIAFAAGALATPALASNPYPVRLLAPVDLETTSSDPSSFTAAGGLALFLAWTPSTGREMWATDGTPAGTLMLADACPGRCDSQLGSSVALGGRMLLGLAGGVWSTDGTRQGTRFLFAGGLIGALDEDTALLGRNERGRGTLWSTDGTPEGTRLVLELDDFSTTSPLVFAGGALLFSRFGELWRTDGTAAGTFRLHAADFFDGPPVAVAGGRAFFVTVDDGEPGLWVTDGTVAGTVEVRDAAGTPFRLTPDHLTAVGDRLFFIGTAVGEGRALWVSDATPGGTFRLTDFGRPPDLIGTPLGTEERIWVVVANFDDGSKLWVSDGTVAGTEMLAPIPPPMGPSFQILHLTAAGDRVYFNGDDGVSGGEPWVSDGTPAGTHRLVDICPGACTSEAYGFRAFTSGVYFGAFDEDNTSSTLWVTDGTVAGTRRVVDVCTGSCHRGLAFWREWRGEVYFVEDTFADLLWKTDGTPEGTIRLHDSVEAEPFGGEAGGALVFPGREFTFGGELWRTDGTPVGTRLLADLASGEPLGPRLRTPVAFGERLLQPTDLGSESLWASDGTPQGTVDLRTAHPRLAAASIQIARAATDLAFFSADETPGEIGSTNLWLTDGTLTGTEPLTDFTGERPSLAGILGTLGRRVFFFVRDGSTRLWVSDGTSRGTVPIATAIESGFDASAAGAVSVAVAEGTEEEEVEEFGGVVRGRFVFAMRSGSPVSRLWRSDGTAAGTRPLGPAEATGPRAFTPAGDRLFFRTGDNRVWVTDGTDAGTRPVAGPFQSVPTALAGVAGRLFFAALDLQGGEEPWTSDGTPAGTRPVADLHAGSASSRPREFTAGPGDVGLFVADDGIHGRELWRTDGTAAGTYLVADIFPGAHGSDPASLEAAGGRVLFAARGADHGRELWQSDGTAAGTWLLADVDPGPASSSPRRLRTAGDRVFFHADRGTLGEALWAYVWRGPAPSATPAAPSGLTADYDNGRVELSWRDHAVDEAIYVVERTSPATSWQTIAYLTPDTDRFNASIPVEPITFRVRAENGAGVSPWSNEVSVTASPPSSSCVADGTALCLLDKRFEVRVIWRDQRSGDVGEGRAESFPGSDRTGTFSFFDPANVELIVKVLDGRTVNGAFWSFFGALSDVEYWVTVTDTAGLRRRTYHNSPGEICGRGDTAAFPEIEPLADGLRMAPPPSADRSPSARPVPRPGSAGACVPDPESLCLLGGRLRIEVTWSDQHNGGSGTGKAVPGTDKTGYFWFFDSGNAELVVKALDGTEVNGHLWVFWGALSDVEYTITVTDTETGQPAEYHNPPGEICGGADTAAF